MPFFPIILFCNSLYFNLLLYHLMNLLKLSQCNINDVTLLVVGIDQKPLLVQHENGSLTAPGPSSSSLYKSYQLEICSDENLSSNEEESCSSISSIPADKSKVVSLLSRLKPLHVTFCPTNLFQLYALCLALLYYSKNYASIMCTSLADFKCSK